MHILISNDDGINARGIRVLTEAMMPLARKITVIAPELNQSATGHKKTLTHPLRIRPVKDYIDGVEAYAIDGSPSDCVAVAMLGFIQDKVDLVVSGINRGPNLAQDVTYSGTVAVALEAAIYGLPAVAFSLDSRSPDANFEQHTQAVRQITQATYQNGLPPLTILNVNFPDYLSKGWKVTRQGVREYHDQLIRREDPDGRPYYWLGGESPTGDVEMVDTDLWAVNAGYASLTPIHLDLTAHRMLDSLKSWEVDF